MRAPPLSLLHWATLGCIAVTLASGGGGAVVIGIVAVALIISGAFDDR